MTSKKRITTPKSRGKNILKLIATILGIFLIPIVVPYLIGMLFIETRSSENFAIMWMTLTLIVIACSIALRNQKNKIKNLFSHKALFTIIMLITLNLALWMIYLLQLPSLRETQILFYPTLLLSGLVFLKMRAEIIEYEGKELKIINTAMVLLTITIGLLNYLGF